ncbi:acetylornithine deacetylase (ArgE) [Rhodobacterales bacterium 52_120_T64]|nr:acetylornithine deacetylase (ArgE) [Rhodobacterales bacterium 52_120_T64]
MPTHYNAKEMLEKLVAFPSVSSESNLPIIEFIESYLAEYGVKSWRVYDETGLKSNLYAQIGPNVEGGVVLSGHTDVVPVIGQEWDTDPFVLTEIDGKLFGRGSCDMKGFIATGLSLVPEMLAADLKYPIQFALSYDEEIGCLGAPFMISEMVDKLPKAKAVIVGEPSMMQVVTGHKGAIGFVTKVHGFEIHSSLMHNGVSAVMTAARLVEWLRVQFSDGMLATPNEIDALFEPPFTTFHVGVMNGGTATNITAKYCEFSTDIRCPPSQSPQDWFDRYMEYVAIIESEIQAIRPEAYIEVIARDVNPALKPETDGSAEVLVRQVTGDNGTHAVSYGTEAGQFQREGYSTVVCGPGSIEQAHQPNEFIEVSQLYAGENFIRKLIEKLK